MKKWKWLWLCPRYSYFLIYLFCSVNNSKYFVWLTWSPHVLLYIISDLPIAPCTTVHNQWLSDLPKVPVYYCAFLTLWKIFFQILDEKVNSRNFPGFTFLILSLPPTSANRKLVYYTCLYLTSNLLKYIV